MDLAKEVFAIKTFSDALIEETIKNTVIKSETKIVNNMLKSGISPFDIAKWTGIELEFIKNIADSLKEDKKDSASAIQFIHQNQTH